MLTSHGGTLLDREVRHAAASSCFKPREPEREDDVRDPLRQAHDADVDDEQDHLLVKVARDPERQAELDQADDQLDPPELVLALRAKAMITSNVPLNRNHQPMIEARARKVHSGFANATIPAITKITPRIP